MRPMAPPDLLEADRAVGGAVALGAERRGRALRRRGWSYGEIRELIDVPTATLSGWCRDIRLPEDQIAAIKDRGQTRRGVPRDTQRKRRAEIERIREEAGAFATAHLHDPLFVAGTVLYWGEGAKTSPRLMMTNADPRALGLFVSWVTRFHEADPRFVLALHLHEGNDDETARTWWVNALELTDAEFTRTFVKPARTGHRKNHLPHGVCRVGLRRSANAWHATMAWIDVIAELG